MEVSESGVNSDIFLTFAIFLVVFLTLRALFFALVFEYEDIKYFASLALKNGRGYYLLSKVEWARKPSLKSHLKWQGYNLVQGWRLVKAFFGFGIPVSVLLFRNISPKKFPTAATTVLL